MTSLVSRRCVLAGLLAAPMIVRSTSIMPVKLLLVEDPVTSLNRNGQFSDLTFMEQHLLELLTNLQPLPYDPRGWEFLANAFKEVCRK